MVAAQTTRGDPGLVAVLGAGKMGMQIALEYALGGHHVACIVRDHDAALDRLESWATLIVDLKVTTSDALQLGRQRMVVVAHDRRLPFHPDLIVESLPEDMALKVRALGALTSEFPQATVATNTSSLSVTDLGSAIGARERTIGTHYLNPALLMPLVEVVPGSATSPKVISETLGRLEELGKEPILVRGEPVGFVWNRLQFAILREAVALVEEGVVSPEDIDLVVGRGLARRWRAIGPFGTAALGGVETFIAAARNIVPRLSDQQDISGLRSMIEADTAALEQRRNKLLAEDLRDDRRA